MRWARAIRCISAATVYDAKVARIARAALWSTSPRKGRGEPRPERASIQQNSFRSRAHLQARRVRFAFRSRRRERHASCRPWAISSQESTAAQGGLNLERPLGAVRASVLRRHRAQIGDHGIKIIRTYRGVVVETHRWLETTAVAADSLSNGALDLGVSPSTDPVGFALGDVA